MNYIPPLDGSPPVSQNYGDSPGGLNPPAGHNGRDYAVPVGTPVRAVADGVIDFEGWTTGPYDGNPWWFLPGDMVIVLNTGDTGPSFVYGHLNDTCVAGGERVKQGDIIGYTGNTGASTGPHLHFEALPPNYDLHNGSYGRTDPGPYIDHQPPFQEEQDTDMALTQADKDLIQSMHDVTRSYIVDQVTKQVNQFTQDASDVTRGYLADKVRDGGDAGKIAATIITELGDDLAADVVAEVGKQLVQAGKQLSN